MKAHVALVICLLVLGGLQVSASTVLFDFEKPADLSVWHNEGSTVLGSDKKLTQSELFAASGKYSMLFQTPAWRPQEHGGAQRWPAFEGTPPITDWSKYDRLVMSLVNVTDAPQKLMLFITDSKHPTRSGANFRVDLGPRSQAQAVMSLRKAFADRKLDARDIKTMHFFTEDPPEDLAIHIDRLLLLQPDEAVPTLPTSYFRQIGDLQKDAALQLGQTVSDSFARMRETAKDSPAALKWLGDEQTKAEARVAAVRTLLERGDESVLGVSQEVASVNTEVAHAESLLGLHLSFDKVRSAVQVDPAAGAEVAVGFATSMEKVLPRAGVPALKTRRSARLALAQNEKESLQVVVLPFERDLKQVSVQVTDLVRGDGQTFAASNIDTVLMGYVQTKAVPPYGSSHVGWWPDPILNFLHEADVARGDAQSFWVRVRAPKNQAPGVYRGKLKVMTGTTTAFAFDFSVQVYGFRMPDVSPLPMAITFKPGDHPMPDTQAQQAEYRKSPDYPINAWRRHKSEWADMLADYYITYDSLYGYADWAPDFVELKRLHDEGRLGTFNLGYYGTLGESEAAVKSWQTGTIDRLKPRYEKAKELGILDHAYIYGCDENPKEAFPGVQRAAKSLKEHFPGVPIMTTTYDNTYGQETEIKSMDAWCPLTPRFDVARAAEVRKLGREVWWYICCGPHHPYCNMFIEYPAIEGRILMGAQTARQRPDGFLYYQISIWNSAKCIDSGPFTDWDPRSWTTYHGDGSWTCAGPDGTPLPTIRLENFRDGLEDYAYYRTLEALVAQVEASSELKAAKSEWLTEAKQALQVPDSLTKSMAVYTRDPAAVYRYRTRLAAAIESAGLPAPELWADGSPRH
jgi:hypothetical protein